MGYVEIFLPTLKPDDTFSMLLEVVRHQVAKGVCRSMWFS